jgi:hypothetical protein
MKKVLNKLRRKKQQPETPGRITTDTLAEQREKILAGGRRFKYPMQYARHKLVYNAIIVGVAAVALTIVIGWWQLYVVQNTSDFMYRVTRVIPVPVASVDGQQVRYSDYLLKYRGSVHYLREIEGINFNTEDGQRQADFVKSQEIADAMADTYAQKLARELDLSVSDTELEEVLRQQRFSDSGEQSEAAYYSTIRDFYGWSADEYREITRVKLLRQKVAFAIDERAQQTAETVAQRIEGGDTDLRELADSLNEANAGSVQYGALGTLPRSNQDGGITAAAAQLEEGEISEAIRSTTGDGLFFVRLLEKNSREVNYQYIQIPLTVFSTQFAEVQQGEQTSIHIEIPEVEAPQQ